MESYANALQDRAEPAVVAGAAAASSSSISTFSAALAAVGVVSLVISISVAGYIVYRARKASAAPKPAKLQIGSPQLKFAPKHAVEGIDISTLTDAQRQLLSVRQHRVFPATHISNLPASTTWGVTSSSSGETSTSGPDAGSTSGSDIMRPGDSEQGTPARPRTSVRLSMNAGRRSEDRDSFGFRRVNRVAVPSMLLKSLGDLPPLPAPGSSAPKTAPSISSHPPKLDLPQASSSADKVEDEAGSLTPILDLDLSLSTDLGGAREELKLEDELDFEIERSMWLSSTLSNAFDGKKPLETRQSTSERPANSSSPASNSKAPVEKSGGSISQSHGGSSNSLQPHASGILNRGRSATISTTGRSASGTITESLYHSAASGPDTPNTAPKVPTMHTSIAMPDSPTRPREADRSSFARATEELIGFRPLSLGLTLASSSSTSLGSNLFKNVRRSLFSETAEKNNLSDIESGSSHAGDSSRDWTSPEDEPSPPSSSTSLEFDDEMSISKASIVPVGSLPPLPPLPVHLRRSGEESTASSPSPVKKDGIKLIPARTEIITRDRASTFGAGSKGAMDVVVSMTEKIPALPSKAGSQQTRPAVLQISNVQLPASTAEKIAFERDIQEKSRKMGNAMSFMTPFHHAIFPDVLEPEPKQSVDSLAPHSAQSPILAQIGASGSPRPSFTDSLKARLSFSSRKNSFVGQSPVPTPSTPTPMGSRLTTPQQLFLDKFPKPSLSRAQEDNASLASTSFDHPATEQWAVNTSDTEDEDGDDTSFPAVAVRGLISSAAPRKAPAIGLGFTDVGTTQFRHPYVKRSSILEAAVSSQPAGRDSSQSNNTLNRASPIMQSDKWAREEIDVGIAAPKASLDVDRNSSHGERIDFEALNASLSRRSSTRAAMSPLSVVEQEIGRASMESPRIPQGDRLSPRTGLDFPRFSSPKNHSFRQSTWSARLSTHSQGLASPRSDGGADTISISSSCMTGCTDAMGDGLELAVDRRAKLLASVQQNAARDKARDDRSSRRTSRSRRTSIRRSEQGAQQQQQQQANNFATNSSLNFGLGLYHTSPSNPSSPSRYMKKPSDLVLGPQSSLLGASNVIGPLTPPLTPIDANVPLSASTATVTAITARSPSSPSPQPQSSVAGGNSVRQPTRIPAPAAPALLNGSKHNYRNSAGPEMSGPVTGCLPSPKELHVKVMAGARSPGSSPHQTPQLTAPAAVHMTPGPGSPASAFPTYTPPSMHNAPSNTNSSNASRTSKLRPLSLAASSVLGGSGADMISPTSRKFGAGTPSYSPSVTSTIASPSLNSNDRERARQLAEERRQSRGIASGAGGVLPTVNSSGALCTGQAKHAYADLCSSESKDSIESGSSQSTINSKAGGALALTTRPITPSIYYTPRIPTAVSEEKEASFFGDGGIESSSSVSSSQSSADLARATASRAALAAAIGL
ncbi:hypothetical protein IE53DRAFT_365477 [Violaceomyces palustris]|uniref:Uncharacterized protein n=1 Tax=Violaceomyces palustris TaxID=1673888 RepID=A0ACD0P8G7_9BASI|nr:hypothetical protein IE53DRAFT_365477 [Violaceomyces palustris]